MMLELLGHAGNFFLGFCVMLGAAFVFQRSKRAALWVALGGLCYALAVPLEYFVSHMGMRYHMTNYDVMVYFTLVNVARHIALFGGLTMGIRTIAMETT